MSKVASRNLSSKLKELLRKQPLPLTAHWSFFEALTAGSVEVNLRFLATFLFAEIKRDYQNGEVNEAKDRLERVKEIRTSTYYLLDLPSLTMESICDDKIISAQDSKGSIYQLVNELILDIRGGSILEIEEIVEKREGPIKWQDTLKYVGYKHLNQQYSLLDLLSVLKREEENDKVSAKKPIMGLTKAKTLTGLLGTATTEARIPQERKNPVGQTASSSKEGKAASSTEGEESQSKRKRKKEESKGTKVPKTKAKAKMTVKEACGVLANQHISIISELYLRHPHEDIKAALNNLSETVEGFTRKRLLKKFDEARNVKAKLDVQQMKEVEQPAPEDKEPKINMDTNMSEIEQEKGLEKHSEKEDHIEDLVLSGLNFHDEERAEESTYDASMVVLDPKTDPESSSEEES